MVTSNKSNWKEEERLAEEIRKSPCLYDICNKGYKKQNRKKIHRLVWRMPSTTMKIHKLHYIGTLDVIC